MAIVTFLYVVSYQHFTHIQAHGFRSHILICSSRDTIIHESANDWEIEHIYPALSHRNSGDVDLGQAHQCESDVLNEWWLRSHLHSKANSANKAFELNPNCSH